MYGKIFEQIYDGSLRLNWKAMVTFQQMIVLCNEDGTIDMTPQALHFRTGIPLEIIKEGIEILEQDDPESRTQHKNGKRIERMDRFRTWGWRLVNHKYYKNLASWEEKKEKDRTRIAQKREEEKCNKNKVVAKCSDLSQDVVNVAYTDTYIDKDKKKNTQKKRACSWPKDFRLTDDLITFAVKNNIEPNLTPEFFQDFKDWALSKDAKYKDWKAAFRTRVRKAPVYSPQFVVKKDDGPVYKAAN